MGFDGIVMSDGVAIDQLDSMTGDNVVSGALALSLIHIYCSSDFPAGTGNYRSVPLLRILERLVSVHAVH